MDKADYPFHIVLIEPEIPPNTGNIARTCAATGCALHLVGPMGFKIDDAKLKRAGLDYWHLLPIFMYDSTEEFFARNKGEFFYFSTKGAMRHSDVDYPAGAYLVFRARNKGAAGGAAGSKLRPHTANPHGRWGEKSKFVEFRRRCPLRSHAKARLSRA